MWWNHGKVFSSWVRKCLGNWIIDGSTKDCRQPKSLLLLLSFCWHFLHVKMMNLNNCFFFFRKRTWIIVSFYYTRKVKGMIILFNLIRIFFFFLNHTKVTLFVSNCLRKISLKKKKQNIQNKGWSFTCCVDLLAK